MLSPLIENFLRFEGKSTFPSLETILFIREIIEVHTEHKVSIFNKICAIFGEIKSHLVIRVALWIIGEYAASQAEVAQAFATIKRNIGSLPIYSIASQEIDESK
jgi:coatomer subunit beta